MSATVLHPRQQSCRAVVSSWWRWLGRALRCERRTAPRAEQTPRSASASRRGDQARGRHYVWPRLTPLLGWAAAFVVFLLVQLSPALQSWLQYDREAIAGGAVWRLLTGNVVHYGWQNWAADVGAFAALCWICRGRARGLLWVVLASALAVSAGLYLWAVQVPVYRGISGVSHALLAWALITMAAQDGSRRAVVWLLVLSLWTAKVVYEWLTGHLLLPTTLPSGVAVAGLAHVVGLGVGVCAGLGLLALRASFATQQGKHQRQTSSRPLQPAVAR